jgi:RimJ/RimL family protein N-acetyltransferase
VNTEDDGDAEAPQLVTERLVLRGWRAEDRAPFAALNADPCVMRFLTPPMGRAASDALVDRIHVGFHAHGFGLWALEVPGSHPFIGFVGLAVPSFEAHFTPCVEIGWRLTRSAWGQGYATEGANAVLDFAFEEAALAEVVAFTARTNERSRQVMRRLGMGHDPREDFDHPRLEPGDPLRPHVLYRMSQRRWRALRP